MDILTVMIINIMLFSMVILSFVIYSSVKEERENKEKLALAKASTKTDRCPQCKCGSRNKCCPDCGCLPCQCGS